MSSIRDALESLKFSPGWTSADDPGAASNGDAQFDDPTSVAVDRGPTGFMWPTHLIAEFRYLIRTASS
jgi:hypothetical protein